MGIGIDPERVIFVKFFIKEECDKFDSGEIWLLKKKTWKAKNLLPITRVVDNLVDSYQFDAEKIKMNKHSSIIFAKLSAN